MTDMKFRVFTITFALLLCVAISSAQEGQAEGEKQPPPPPPADQQQQQAAAAAAQRQAAAEAAARQQQAAQAQQQAQQQAQAEQQQQQQDPLARMHVDLQAQTVRLNSQDAYLVQNVKRLDELMVNLQQYAVNIREELDPLKTEMGQLGEKSKAEGDGAALRKDLATLTAVVDGLKQKQTATDAALVGEAAKMKNNLTSLGAKIELQMNNLVEMMDERKKEIAELKNIGDEEPVEMKLANWKKLLKQHEGKAVAVLAGFIGHLIGCILTYICCAGRGKDERYTR